ncbi:putative inorganic polyphosphate/ATP-NAD kinase [Gossypium arboreum]|uniref:Putative inorganic polyphosphate/ATP-NAD kinase n=1 Tax=Gossypium arboreum TaxID=29729 RepID=A0A0B0PUY0_GOSAR|nr:putative inorganic polyphosphate/ATP-NAD kinase [Gossypium arboreum]
MQEMGYSGEINNFCEVVFMKTPKRDHFVKVTK